MVLTIKNFLSASLVFCKEQSDRQSGRSWDTHTHTHTHRQVEREREREGGREGEREREREGLHKRVLAKEVLAWIVSSLRHWKGERKPPSFPSPNHNVVHAMNNEWDGSSENALSHHAFVSKIERLCSREKCNSTAKVHLWHFIGERERLIYELPRILERWSRLNAREIFSKQENARECDRRKRVIFRSHSRRGMFSARGVGGGGGDSAAVATVKVAG